MIIDKSTRWILADCELGENYLIKIFISNIKELSEKDCEEILTNVFQGKSTYSALEYISVVNSVVNKLEVK